MSAPRLVLLALCAGFFASSLAQVAMPVGDLPGWKQIFTEDFTTPCALGSFLSTYASKWGAYPEGWSDTSKNGVYTPNRTLSVVNGSLQIYLHTDSTSHCVCAPQPRLYGPGISAFKGLLYGRYSVRFKSDQVSGYKTAWLLWPDSNVWPGDGEIDFPEGDLTSTISAFAHHANASGGQDAFPTTQTYVNWHVATIEWLPNNLTFYLDGVKLGTSTTNVPSKPMHWVLQTETKLTSTPPSNSSAGNVYVDWVVAYNVSTAPYVPPPQPTPNTLIPSPILTPILPPSDTPTPTPTPIITLPPVPIPQSAPVPPSGVPIPTADLPCFSKIFSEDFTTDAALGSFLTAYPQWGAYPEGWTDTSKNGTYSPNRTLSASNGYFDIWLHTVNGTHVVAAPQPRLFGPGQDPFKGIIYGRYALLFRSDSLPGFKTNWVLWPDSNLWPTDGSIVFPSVSLSGTSTMRGIVNYANASGGQASFSSTATPGNWHTLITEWTPGQVEFFMDGISLGRTTTSVPSKPLHWILQTETSGIPNSATSGHISIDWVVVWNYTVSTCATSPSPVAQPAPLTQSPPASVPTPPTQSPTSEPTPPTSAQAPPTSAPTFEPTPPSQVPSPSPPQVYSPSAPSSVQSPPPPPSQPSSAPTTPPTYPTSQIAPTPIQGPLPTPPRIPPPEPPTLGPKLSLGWNLIAALVVFVGLALSY